MGIGVTRGAGLVGLQKFVCLHGFCVNVTASAGTV
jgi:hypothetical protein